MISVCIATYNGGENFRIQLDSIVSQLSPNDEIIISDDGSTDSTLEIIRQTNFANIHCIQGPRKSSPIANFEHALTQAKGDYIFLSDQDDKWVKHKVKTMVALLKDGVECVVSDCYVTNGALEITHSSFFQQAKLHQNKWYNLFARNFYLGCCMAFSRKVLNKALPFPHNIPMHDIWIGNVAAFGFNVVFLKSPLIYFRRHNNNSSSTAAPSPYSLRKKISFRWHIIKPLLFRFLCNR